MKRKLVRRGLRMGCLLNFLPAPLRLYPDGFTLLELLVVLVVEVVSL
jgi:type II secretory pathway pseudopilin PulG